MRILLYFAVAFWAIIVGIWDTVFPQGIFHVDPLRTIVILLFMVLFFWNLLLRRKFYLDAVIISGCMFVIFALYNLLINPTYFEKWQSAVFFLDTYMTAIMMYYILLNNKDAVDSRSIALCILTCGFCIALIGIAEMLAGHNLIGQYNKYSVTEGMRLFRTNGPFYDVISYSAIVLLYVPFTYLCMKRGLIGSKNGVTLIILFIIGSSINFSRATILAMILVLLLLVTKSNIRNLFVAIYLFILGGVLVYLLVDTMLSFEIIGKRILDKGTFLQRANQYELVFREFASAPFFGIGYNMFTKRHTIPMHNSFLKILAEFGGIGFILFFYFICKIAFKKIMEIIRNRDMTLLAVRLSLAVIVFLVGSTIDLLGNREFLLTLLIITSFCLYIDHRPGNHSAGEVDIVRKNQ